MYEAAECSDAQASTRGGTLHRGLVRPERQIGRLGGCRDEPSILQQGRALVHAPEVRSDVRRDLDLALFDESARMTKGCGERDRIARGGSLGPEEKEEDRPHPQ